MNFDNEALTWDDEKRVSRAKVISQEIVKAIEIKKSYSALEFGCGTGLISFNIHDSFHSVTLVDNSRGMISILNSKIEDNKIQNMEAYCTDINNESILTGTYDVIYTSMAMHHIQDTEKTLKSLFELLNKDGFLCIVDLDEEDGSFHGVEKDFTGHNGFNQLDLTNLLYKVGFEEIESKIIYRDKKTVGNELVDYSLFLMKGRKR